MSKNKIHFKPLSKNEKSIVLDWFEKEHVKDFYYGDGLKNTLNNIDLYCQGIRDNGRYSFDHWVAYADDKPFGFLMTSIISKPYDRDDPYQKWYKEDYNTYTLDLLIGNLDFLGKGLAFKMIKAFILGKYVDAGYFLIDPEISNTKAIHVYEKVGFKKVDEIRPAYNSIPHAMMRLCVNQLRKSTI